MRAPPRRLVARTRGQVMVLGVASLLVMALMLMASFSVSNAIHEKIRIQNHADAAAYSVAVMEARAFNVTTHYNRAIAATLVAQMSLHSWMAIASVNVAQLEGLEESLGMIIVSEIAQYHFACAAIAAINLGMVQMAYMDWVDKLKQHEQAFNDAVRALRETANALKKAQQAVLGRMNGNFDTGSQILSFLQKNNASRSTWAGNGLLTLNRGDFYCAMEGSQFDEKQDQCDGWKQRAKASTSDRSVVMENAANAARPKFDVGGGQLSELDLPSNWNHASGNVPKDQLFSGTWRLLTVSGSAGLSRQKGSSPNPQDEGVSVGASYSGSNVVTNYLQHAAPGFGYFTADIFSDSQGGEHNVGFMGSSDSNHREFKGEQMEDPCQESNCFVNYRADSSSTHDFGQPSVYQAVSQNLRLYHLKDNGGFQEHAGWEINDQGKVQVELVKGDPATINYVARGNGYAVSKAKVYFHQMGNWQAPPNFFDPFWRAKLHFFSRSEMEQVLKEAGDQIGGQLLTAGAPVEGEDQ